MGLLDEIKSITTIIQKIDNIELYQKILDIQEQAMDLIEENRILKRKIEELEEKLKIKESVIFKDQMYWINVDEKLDGPFCTRCWDKDRNLIRLHEYDNGWGTIYMECPECNTSVVKDEYEIDDLF